MMTIVPSKETMAAMIDWEERDYGNRLRLIEEGRADPGRKLLFPPHMVSHSAP